MKIIFKLGCLVSIALLFALTNVDITMAADAKATLDTGDTAWMLTSTVIVLMMTIPGVALFYAGMVRKRNVLATLMQSFAITCLVTIIWMVLGYSLAFSKGNSSLIGNLDLAFLNHLTVGAINGTIPDTVFVVFQATFAIITAALITGAVAERMKFSRAPLVYWLMVSDCLFTGNLLGMGRRLPWCCRGARFCWWYCGAY